MPVLLLALLIVIALFVVGFAGTVISVYALAYGRHDAEPARVLPFYPLFLAGMTLVVLADDAFTFLVSWEFMSLTSWALVISQHRVADNVRAGYVYLVMAGFGTLALLLAFGLLPALRAARRSPQQTLREGGRTDAAGARDRSRRCSSRCVRSTASSAPASRRSPNSST